MTTAFTVPAATAACRSCINAQERLLALRMPVRLLRSAAHPAHRGKEPTWLVGPLLVGRRIGLLVHFPDMQAWVELVADVVEDHGLGPVAHHDPGVLFDLESAHCDIPCLCFSVPCTIGTHSVRRFVTSATLRRVRYRMSRRSGIRFAAKGHTAMCRSPGAPAGALGERNPDAAVSFVPVLKRTKEIGRGHDPDRPASSTTGRPLIRWPSINASASRFGAYGDRHHLGCHDAHSIISLLVAFASSGYVRNQVETAVDSGQRPGTAKRVTLGGA